METGTVAVAVALLILTFAANAEEPTMPDRLRALWDMADVREVPLDPEKLSTRKAPLFVKGLNDWMRVGDTWVAGPRHAGNAAADESKPASNQQLAVEEWHYTSGSTSAGPNRVFGALAYPEHSTKPPPVILVFHGGGGHGSGALAVATARRNPGMAAFSMDYNGQFRPGRGHVTQWRSITQELRGPRLRLAPNLRNCPMYHYVTAARRAIDFLQEQGKFDTAKIGCFGISYGGWVALILAGVDERVKCVVNGVSAGGTEGTASRSSQPLRWRPKAQRALWLATYDPIVYAPWTRAAVLLKICSNDRFFWLSGAMRNYAALAGPKRLLVTPNSDHGAGGPALPDPSPAWVRQILLGGHELPDIPLDGLKWDGRVCTWQVRGPRPIERAILCWSPGKVVSCARYWVGFDAEPRDGRWQARIPDRYAGLAGEAYVTVFDDRGAAVSSCTVTRDGIDPYTQPALLWPNDWLWDAPRGADAWRPLTPGGGPKTALTAAPGSGVSIGPADGGKRFAALTNSVVLASGSAEQHKGISLVIRGNGAAGALAISIVRDATSLDEAKYTAPAEYGEQTTRLDLPWSAFKASGRRRLPKHLWPFNGLMLEGERTDGSPITVERIAFLD